eukprot:scaffold333_cov133-Cylindrotheca_fusiformis.AAC.55
MQPEEAATSEKEFWIYNGQDEVPKAVRCVKIAENVEKIPDEAFKSREALEEVIIPTSVKEIGKSAFEDCINLKSVHLHLGQFQTIGEKAFDGCKSLTSTVKVFDPCTICMDNQKTHAFVPCGHLALCTDCASQPSYTTPSSGEESMHCPICREDSTMVMKIAGR